MTKIDISKNVETLDFGHNYDARIQRICRDFNITTIRGLCQWSGKDFMKVNDIGKRSIEEIEAVLKKYNLRLGMLKDELDEYAGIETSQPEEWEEDAKWAQRRYEVAKELFVHYRTPAVTAVNEADELIRALRYSQHP